jgi:hypothetical protein
MAGELLDAFRGWWHGPNCRLGLTATEAATSLIEHLDHQGFKIVPKLSEEIVREDRASWDARLERRT